MSRRPKIDRSAFTVVELLVVVGIIAILMGLLLPAVNSARDRARVSTSQSNLRNISEAFNTYASDWTDRQMTLTPDTITSYGTDPTTAIAAWQVDPTKNGAAPPAIVLSWTLDEVGKEIPNGYYFGSESNHQLIQPINFVVDNPLGWYRIPNASPLNRYLNGRFYDRVFYAPKDELPMRILRPMFEAPIDLTISQIEGLGDDNSGTGQAGWSSYCLSPAALVNPDVMRNPQEGGWQDPWDLGAGLRVPSMGQVRHSSLKTHLLEHHWLQRPEGACNREMPFETWDNCEPYYFNHGQYSTPVTLFYDGHIDMVNVESAMRADSQQQQQSMKIRSLMFLSISHNFPWQFSQPKSKH